MAIGHSAVAPRSLPAGSGRAAAAAAMAQQVIVEVPAPLPAEEVRTPMRATFAEPSADGAPAAEGPAEEPPAEAEHTVEELVIYPGEGSESP